MCLKYAPRKALVWVFLVPNHECASGPWPPFGLSSLLLSTTGLSSKYSTSHMPGPLGGAPTLNVSQTGHHGATRGERASLGGQGLVQGLWAPFLQDPAGG